MTRTRDDYRYAPEGSFKHYLLYLYPLGHPYSSVGRHPPERLHDTRRDKSGNFQSLAGGRPDLDPLFVSYLEGVPASRVRETIELLSTSENPRTLRAIRALKWYQNARLNKAMGVTPDVAADDLGVSASTFRSLRDTAIDLVADALFRVGRNRVDD